MSERFASTIDGSKIKAERAKCDVNGDQIDTTYAKIADVPAAQVQADWDETDTESAAFILHKPTIPAAQVQSNWNETNTSSKAYIRNKPTIPAAQVQSNWNETNTNSKAYIQNKPDLATVATSGDYDDLSNKPTIPAAPVQSDWEENNSSSLAFIQNKPTLADVATSGEYSDLLHKPDLNVGSYHRLLKYSSTELMFDLEVEDQNTASGYAVVDADDIIGWHEAGQSFVLYESDLSGFISGDSAYQLVSYTKDSGSPTLVFSKLYQSGNYTKGKFITYVKEDTGNLDRMVMSGLPVDKTLPTMDQLATVAISGDYEDLSNKPTIPVQAQADWDETDASEPSFIQNKPDLSEYATASDIKDSTISLKIENDADAFDSFTLNQSSDKTIEVPLATSGASVAASTSGAMSAADKYKLDNTNNVYLDATGEGATDESVINACAEKDNEFKTYFVKEKVVIIDEEDPETPIIMDRYNIYKYNPDKVPVSGAEFPDNSKYVLVDAASYSAAEIDELLMEEVTEAVDTIRSRILYTMDLGAVRGREQFPGVSQPYVFFTLFSPSMTMEINTDTTIVIGMTDSGQFTESNVFMYIALYEIDMASGTMNWIANTDNLANLAGINTTGVKHTKLHSIATTMNNEPLELRSDKLYYAAIITNKNSVKLLGTHVDSQVNCTPSVGRQIQSHYGQNDYTEDMIRTLDGSFTLSGGNELTNTVFVAITNIELNNIEPANAPFDIINSFRLLPRSSNEWLGSSADQDEVFQTISPDNDCTITSWAIIDNIESPTNKTLGKVFTVNYTVIHEDDDPNNPSGTVVTEEVGTNMYKHTYTPNTPINLSSTGDYYFPAASYIDPTDQDVMLYQYNGHVGRDITFFKGITATVKTSTDNHYPFGCYLYVTGSYDNNGVTVEFEGNI